MGFDFPEGVITTDGSGSGGGAISSTYTVGAGGVTAGDVVRIDAATGTVIPAQADTIVNATGVVGIAQTTQAAATSVEVTPVGTILAGSWAAPQIGQKIYLDPAVAGGMTTIVPSTVGEYIVRIVHVVDDVTDEIAVDLDYPIEVTPASPGGTGLNFELVTAGPNWIVPAGVTTILVEVVGGGGGGGFGWITGDAGFVASTNGGDTIFDTITARGGVGGNSQGDAQSGAGGAGGINGDFIGGETGSPGQVFFNTAGGFSDGRARGGTGGGVRGGGAQAGAPAGGTLGSGGGGGSATVTTPGVSPEAISGGGGGEGEHRKATLNVTPGASLSVTIGSGGTGGVVGAGGTGTRNGGGAGGAGYVKIWY